MGDLKMVLKPKSGKHGYEISEFKADLANKYVFSEFSERRQTDEIYKAMRGMVKNSDVRNKMLKGSMAITGLPKSADDYPGDYKMDIFVDKERACRVSVEIKEGTGKKIVDVGFKSVSSSEQAAKLLVSLKKNVPFFSKNLTLKNGDGQHAKDLLWRIGRVDSSLPLTTHTKGDGKKNEKVALDKLKKTMKALGYV